VTLRVMIQPMALWLWVGGGVMAAGTILAAWPGRRRRPTDPTSAPVEDEPVPEPVAEAPEPVGVA
jgi:cytochrome c-type biogenesis protein CcmF